MKQFLFIKYKRDSERIFKGFEWNILFFIFFKGLFRMYFKGKVNEFIFFLNAIFFEINDRFFEIKKSNNAYLTTFILMKKELNLL